LGFCPTQVSVRRQSMSIVIHFIVRESKTLFYVKNTFCVVNIQVREDDFNLT
jgi:hypothetical protein